MLSQRKALLSMHLLFMELKKRPDRALGKNESELDSQPASSLRASLSSNSSCASLAGEDSKPNRR